MSDSLPEDHRTRKSTERPFADVFDREPVYAELPYPLPWRKLIAASASWVASKFTDQWQKRTWYGRLKLLLAVPIIFVGALVLTVIGIVWQPSVLLIPVLDVFARLDQYINISTPDTFVEEGER